MEYTGGAAMNVKTATWGPVELRTAWLAEMGSAMDMIDTE
jgi:hypothetical protein